MVSALYSVQIVPVLRKHLVNGQFSLFRLFSAFHWSPSISKPHMTPVSFVKTEESFEVSLDTISRQISLTPVFTVETMKSYEVCR